MNPSRESKIVDGKLPCTRCNKVLSLVEFRKKLTGHYHSWCNGCKREHDRFMGRAKNEEAREAWRKGRGMQAVDTAGKVVLEDEK